MTRPQVARAFAPTASFKHQSLAGSKRDRKNMYRGYKGVGLTFLAYGTDDITIHSKRQDGETTKARMQYGCAWATGERLETATLAEDTGPSPLDNYERGTYIQVQFSQRTRPRSLTKLKPSSSMAAWNTILRTKTAIGQVLLGREPTVPLKVKLRLVSKR